MSLSREEKLKRCADCENNFYNLGKNSPSGECWSLKKATSETIYVVGINTPYPDKNSYAVGPRLNCWRPRRRSGTVKWKAPVK